MAKEYRTVDRHGHGTLDLERSIHADGTAWRGWRLVTGALPAEIARIRCDCGNGIITEDEMKVREAAWHRQAAKERRARRAA
jgi:hypothetical protein